MISNLENACLAIQIKNKGYIYWNRNLLILYNIPSIHHIILKNDDYITENKKLINKYRSLYEEAMGTEKVISVREVVEPRNRKGFCKTMTGKIFPLSLESDRPNALLSLLIPENKLMTLTTECISYLSIEQLQELLTKKSYIVNINNSNYVFSKKELLCFIAIFKGKHAGEIALDLNLKQTTIESYIKNLKNKCGVNFKSDLIAFFIDNHILQQIMV